MGSTLFLRILVVFALCWAGWKILQRYFAKTDLDNVPGPPPESFLFGNFKQIFNKQGWDFHRGIAEKYGTVASINALLGEKQLYVHDPKALHHIVVKDQYVYEELPGFLAGNYLMFGEGLLSMMGDKHKRQRKMLNPVFSTANLREMVPTFFSVTEKLERAISMKVREGGQEVDILHWITRAALEIMGQSGLGHSFDTLVDGEPQHAYSATVKQLLPVVFPLFPLRNYVLPYLMKIGTPRFRRFVVDLLPWRTLHKLRDMSDIMYNTSVNILDGKRKAFAAGDEAVSKQIGQGKDLISILMRANMEASDEDKLSDEEVLGQMSTLIFAAMDTTSSTLSRILYILAQHPEVQENLRKELRQFRAQGDFTYDDLFALPYLDAVCRETLRLYPPISMLSRVTQKDVVLPFSSPVHGVNGLEMNEIHLPADTKVIISIIGANRNPDTWGADTYEWKPERWLKPLPETVGEARMPGIYSNLMTFLGGSRACIGFKFSQVAIKTIISILVARFKFEPSDKEIWWAMNGISSPHVVGEFNEPSLPLKVTFA